MNQLFQGIIKQKEVVDIKNYFEDEKQVKDYTCSHCGYEVDDIDLDDDGGLDLRRVPSWVR